MTSAAGNQGGQAEQSWSSTGIFVLASIGAAVGLGNLWRFPYVAGSSGGGAFVLVYLLAAFVVAIPLLMVEIATGRRGQKSPPSSLAEVAREMGSTPFWSALGWLGLVALYLVMSFYNVVAGWTGAYFVKALRGDFVGQTVPETAAVFGTFHGSERCDDSLARRLHALGGRLRGARVAWC